MDVLVTGASGFVGRHVCEALAKKGHKVRALARGSTLPAAPGITPLKGDVVTGEGLAAAMAGADAAIHLVGIIREARGSTFEGVHVEGTQQVLRACAQAGVTRYLHMSALGADSGAKSRYFDTKLKAEGLVEASGLQWTIFRPSLIFGVGDDFFGNVLKNLVAKPPLVPQIGDGRFPFRPVWIGDVAEAMVQSLEREETVGKTITLVGPKEYAFGELLKLVRRTLKSSKPIVPVPLLLMRLGVPLLQVLPAPPITQDQFAMLLAGNTGSPEQMAALFNLEMRALERELPAILGG